MKSSILVFPNELREQEVIQDMKERYKSEWEKFKNEVIEFKKELEIKQNVFSEMKTKLEGT